MQAEEREPDSVISARGYDYFRLLQLLRERGLAPQALNDLSLAFPVADVADVAALADLVDAAACAKALLRPAFMGMLGTAGALPLHYTERIAGSADAGPCAFVDMLSGRALEQFDEAWHKHRLSREDLLQMLLALGGMHGAAQGGAPDAALAQYAALTRRATVSADAVGRALSEYFGVAVRVAQFVGRWELLAPSHRMALGKANTALGCNAALGERQWRYDLRLRVHIAALNTGGYRAFLPTGPAATALRRMFAGLTRAGSARLGDGAGRGAGTEVYVALAPGDVKGAALDGCRQLGYNAFLLTSDEHEPRSELRYHL